MGSMNFGLYPDAEPLQDVQARVGAGLPRRQPRLHLQEHLQGHRVHPRAPRARAAARASSSSATTSATSTTWRTSSIASWSSRRSSCRRSSASSAASAPTPRTCCTCGGPPTSCSATTTSGRCSAAGATRCRLATMARDHGRQRPRRARGQRLHRQGRAGDEQRRAGRQDPPHPRRAVARDRDAGRGAGAPRASKVSRT